MKFQALLEVRYRGQSYELTVAASPLFKKKFEEAHRRQYGFIHQGQEIEVVNLRLHAHVPLTKRKKIYSISKQKKQTVVPLEKINLFWKGKSHPAKVWSRESLGPGNQISGPAVIVEYSATTLVIPGWKAQCDRHLNLILTPNQ